MATEEGVVKQADNATAWVTTTRTAACESCGAKSSCHSLGGGKEMEVEALNPAGAQAGDRVVLGFDTSSLLKAAFLLYVFPVLCLVGGALIGTRLAPRLDIDASLAAAIFGFALFGLVIFYVRAKGNRLARQDRYRPKIIRIIRRPV